MPPLRTDITRELLQELYCDQKLSLTEIGRRLNCAGNTIAHHLRMHHIPVRTLSEASTRYVRRDFDGTEEQSAYLIGFRLGDLNARLTTPAGHSIWLNSRTSRVEQAELFRALFGPYGHAYTAGPDKNGQYMLSCRLNSTFEFLLQKPDSVPEWIQESPLYARAFAAGYTDAEGSFYTFLYRARNEWRSGFNIASEDERIIGWFHKWLVSIGAVCPEPVIDQRATYSRPVHLIVVRRKASLLALIEALEPYLRHPKRVADMKSVYQNVIERNRRWEARVGRKRRPI